MMTTRKIDATLINKLQLEAKHQAQLEKNKILPNKLNKVAWVTINYPWLSLLIFSFVTTVIIELL